MGRSRGGLTSKIHAVVDTDISPIFGLNPLERARTELKLAPGPPDRAINRFCHDIPTERTTRENFRLEEGC
jgi:hypothetical protein